MENKGPGKGRKQCPQCKSYVGVRTGLCSCGHSFNGKQENAISVVEKTENKPKVVKVEKTVIGSTGYPVEVNRQGSEIPQQREKAKGYWSWEGEDTGKWVNF